ncbi:histidine phosphatase superfamily [Aspergillus keveii]|uniref:Histidine phosphatase superfamily n=1 Tax=Aspergillus keveii TaxID=714993 RepID=A0ABR4FXL2_9EURO
MLVYWAILLEALASANVAAGSPVHGQHQGGANTPVIGGNHSASTTPFWQNYNYCQGRNLGATWSPLKDANMVKLQVMHRHGGRSPAMTVPGDTTPWYQCGNPDEFVFMNPGDRLSDKRSPFMKEMTTIDGAFAYTMWEGNCDAGQLTTFGSHQLQKLGRTLRSTYVDDRKFLPKKMDPDFKISHTYIWRTRESVENLMNGLYPLDTRRAGDTLTMHVKPSAIETMITPASACPKLAKLVSAYSSSPAYAATLAPYTAIQDKLVKAYNTTGVSGYNTTGALYDSASATYCHGLGLKGDLTAEDIQTAVIPGTSAYHNLFRQNPAAEQVKRLGVGAWLADILTSLSDRSTKLEVYSAHDASLDMFLSVVADPDLPWPPFGSNVVIELWQKKNRQQVVRIFYEGMVVPAHPDLGCDFSACPLDTLTKFVKKYIPTDFKNECAV